LLSQYSNFSPAYGVTEDYCRQSIQQAQEKQSLGQAAQKGDAEARRRYQDMVANHAKQLRECRQQTWPQIQATWLRLYPCDAKPGAMEDLMDQLINLGYNTVYIEAFYSGQVLLPAAQNRTPWPSVIDTPGHQNVDLLAQAIATGRDRGLKVYAWMFSMNFGSTYALQEDRRGALMRNFYGQTSLAAVYEAGVSFELEAVNPKELFIDPYHSTAQQDFYNLVTAIADRKPDGILFDYIRYPRGVGPNSVSVRVKDLWLYSQATQAALLQRATNQQGQELIRRYVQQGFITATDIAQVRKLFPNEQEPIWQGRTPHNRVYPPELLQPSLNLELWYLSVAHAVQGILDFLNLALVPLRNQNIQGGVVFFPDGNRVIGRGYDSRLQAWDRFPKDLEWHPMAYGVCGETSTHCITDLIARVVRSAPSGTKVSPVLAGAWGRSVRNRPPLETQMRAVQRSFPQLKSVSHFAYSWMEPRSDWNRRQCRL